MRRIASLALAFALALLAVPAGAFVPEFRLLVLPDGTRIEHALVLPEGWQPGRAYPLLLAFPSGAQDRASVEASLHRHWGEWAAKAGWIVASPVAPEGVLFHEGSERHVPAIVRALVAAYHAEGGRAHLAGSGSGGLSAFRSALEEPELFHSMVVLPGHAPSPRDLHVIDRLRDLPIRMYVGGSDTPWVVEARRTEQRLRAAGGRVRLQAFAGEGHVPPSLDGGRLMSILNELRRELGLAGAAPLPGPEAEMLGSFEMLDEDSVADLLDAFHAAASRADLEGYFSLLTSDGVFLGTDPDERWNVSELRAYAEPLFRQGRGWTNRPLRRHVRVSSGGGTAWFDELLEHERYGTCRGTGLAQNTTEGWRIATYSLSFLIPNEGAEAALEASRRTLR